MATRRDDAMTTEENRDPITGEPGAHPVGTGVGAALGGLVAGAATGTVAGPVGTLVGAAIGAVAGGLAGKGVAESIDPTREDAYWRENFAKRPYVQSGASYEDYGPAYSYGVAAYGQHAGHRFDDVEPELARNWNATRGKSSLEWSSARHAASDAWQRLSDSVERATPGDSDRDGK